MIKKYIITGKGYFNCTVNDPFVKGIEISDLSSGYGYIGFTGSEKELDKFIDKLIDNEETFKYINHHEEGEDQGMFFNGINFKELV
tara:strand:+ start:79 stop:336 length:258 start_codon:yes stop_codon:yes gene_type:complete